MAQATLRCLAPFEQKRLLATAVHQSIHAYLRHLHDHGFDVAPEPLGFDASGREVLTYVAGEVPREPLPGWAVTLPVLEDIARLVRRLHDAPAAWEPPADAVWGASRAVYPRGSSRCSTTRNWWTPLLHPLDRAPGLVNADIPARVAAIADAYGMTREQRSQIVPLDVRRAHNTHLTMRAAANVDPVFRRWWGEGIKDRVPRAEHWWADNADAISRALG